MHFAWSATRDKEAPDDVITQACQLTATVAPLAVKRQTEVNQEFYWIIWINCFQDAESCFVH